MIGRTVLHYKILAPLGSGGMGVVYLAEDERLGRQVALKFLPASWLQEPVALERFRVEARAASALSHPGICTIYDIGNDGDAPFIVMEALKGETLRDRITRAGALRVQEILEIGVQLTDALDAAHSRGIVHRDIKPANIFLGEKNRVKVLDFGLAKLGATSSVRPSGSDTTTVAMLAHQAQMTSPGTAVGTVSYMSPEQARGDDVDTRTDLFSVGAVLYEMATGVQAFGGSSIAVTFDGILNRTPKPISQLNPLIPSQLEAVVAKALEKDRELRYQHASDLQAELKRIRRDLEGSAFVTSQGLTAASHAAAPAAISQQEVIIPSRGRWYKTGAVAILVVVTAGIWAWLDRRGNEESAETPVGVQGAVVPGEAPAATPGVASPATPPAEAPPAPGRPVEPTEAQPPPARSERAQPSELVETTPRPGVRPAPAPAGRGTIPEQSTPSAPANTASVQPPTIPTAPAGEPPASTSTARDNAPQPSQSPPPSLTPSTPAGESGAGATPSVPPPVPQKPDTPVSPPPKPSVAPIDDEAAIRGVLRSYEQAIETKDIALYRSIRPRLTAAEETLLRNSFRQVDSQEVTIRVESLNIDGRVATVRIFRQDTLVTGGRRQTQNTTQTLQFEKTASGWVIN